MKNVAEGDVPSFEAVKEELRRRALPPEFNPEEIAVGVIALFNEHCRMNTPIMENVDGEARLRYAFPAESLYCVSVLVPGVDEVVKRLIDGSQVGRAGWKLLQIDIVGSSVVFVLVGKDSTARPRSTLLAAAEEQPDGDNKCAPPPRMPAKPKVTHADSYEAMRDGAWPNSRPGNKERVRFVRNCFKLAILVLIVTGVAAGWLVCNELFGK